MVLETVTEQDATTIPVLMTPLEVHVLEVMVVAAGDLLEGLMPYARG